MLHVTIPSTFLLCAGVCRRQEDLLHDAAAEENLLRRLELQRPRAVGSGLLWPVQGEKVPRPARPRRHH